jgi:hypothetical protein
METIKQNIVSFFDKTWLKVNDILDVEEMKDLGSFQLVLNNILADPLLLVLALGIIASIPYIIHKIRTTHTEKEKRLDALLQELESLEENEEIHKDSPLFKNQPKVHHPDESLGALDNEAYGNEFESSASEKTDDSLEALNPIIQENFNTDLDWDSSNDKWSDLYDHISQEPDEDEQVPTHQSLKIGSDTTEGNLAQKPLKIMDNELSWESNLDEWDEIYDSVAEKPLEADIPAKDPIEKENLSPKIVPTELTTEQEEEEAQEELDKFADSLETISKIAKEPIDTLPEEEKLEEVTNFLEAVSELDKEPIGTLPEEEKSEEVTNFLEAVSELDKEPIDTLPEEEKLEEVTNFLEAVSELEKESIDTIAPTPALNIPERIELSLEEIEPEELKPKLIEQAETSSIPHSTLINKKPLTAGPLLNSMLNSSVSAKTDALVSRLKTFQTELETRFQSLETESETTQETTKTTSQKRNDYQPASVNYKSIRKSRSNKEYLRQLESFIFMAKQKDINSD